MSSGFKNLPPRVRLRDMDSADGDIPSVVRSGNRSGRSVNTFDDTRTIIFSSSVSNVLLSVGLPSGSVHIGSQVSPMITTTANVRRGVADELLTGSDNGYVHAPFKEVDLFELSTIPFFSSSNIYGNRLSSKSSFKISINNSADRIFTRSAKKFSDTADPQGRFFGQDLTGFCYYNAITKRWDQIGLTDPETGQPTHFDYRVEVSPSNGQLIISGFEHFPMQFASLTAGNVPKSYFLITPIDDVPGSPSSYLNADGTPVTPGISDYYATIPASPTTIAFAPFANKYHATSSQTIKMSDYIKRPFKLEKVVVKLNINAERTGSRRDVLDDSYDTFSRLQDDLVFFMYRQEKSPWGTASPAGAYRRITEFVTSSERFLICSGVATFYDGRKLYRTASSPEGFQIKDFRPFNSASFEHDWGFSDAEINAGIGIKTFTGPVEIRAEVATAAKQLKGTQWFPTSNIINISLVGYTSSSAVTNYWPGGSNCLPHGPTSSYGKTFIPPFLEGIPGIDFPKYGTGGLSVFQPVLDATITNISELEDKLQISRSDCRLGTTWCKTNGTFMSVPKSSYYGKYTKSIQQSKKTFYTLLPTDELILGLETTAALPGMIFSTGSVGPPTYITGTFFKLTAGEMSLTFYGEYVKNDEPDQSLTFDNTTSQAVHTFIGEELGDQFDYRDKSVCAFSSDDFTYFGNMTATGSGAAVNDIMRRRYFSDAYYSRIWHVGSAVYSYDYHLYNYSDPTSTQDFTGSFSVDYTRGHWRFNKPVSAERYYDTMFPSMRRILTDCGAVTTASYVKTNNPVVFIGNQALGKTLFKFPAASTITQNSNTFYPSTAPFFEVNGHFNDSLSYIYASDLTRTDDNDDAALLMYTTPYPNYVEGVYTGEALRWLLLGRGTAGYKQHDGVFMGILAGAGGAMWEHHVTGSWSTRYGIRSILPNYSHVVLRKSRFGQFRDMLEQRQFTVFHVKDPIFVGKTEGPVTVKFFSGSLHVEPSNVNYSSNRSLEATSSKPYDDGNYSNWSSVI